MSDRDQTDPLLWAMTWKPILTPTAQASTAGLLSCNAQLCPICFSHAFFFSPEIPLTFSSLQNEKMEQDITTACNKPARDSGDFLVDIPSSILKIRHGLRIQNGGRHYNATKVFNLIIDHSSFLLAGPPDSWLWAVWGSERKAAASTNLLTGHYSFYSAKAQER